MTIAISGSREFSDYEFIRKHFYKYLDGLDTCGPFEIRFGDCRGVDATMLAICKKDHINHRIFYANWDFWGKAAGPKRNEKMLRNADVLLAFWNHKSRGTKSAIDIATKNGIPVIIFDIREAS